MSIAADIQREVTGAPPVTQQASTPPPTEQVQQQPAAVVEEEKKPEGEPATPPPAEKTAEEIAAESLATTTTTPPAGPAAPPVTEPATPPATEDANEEEIVRRFLEKKGIVVNSFDELKPASAAKTEDELATEKAEERGRIIEYGLKNKLINPEDLDAHGRDKNRTPQELAFDVFASAQRASNKDVTEDQIEQRFNDRFGIEEEDGHWKKEEGAREMAFLAQQYMNKTHAGLNSVENSYRAQVQEENSAREYTKAVDKEFSALPTEFEFEVNGKAYKYKLFPETIAAVKEQLTNRAQFDTFGKKVPGGDVLKETILSAIKMKDFGRILAEVAESHASAKLLDHQAGRQGVLPTREGGSQQDGLPAAGVASHARSIQKNTQKK